MTKTYPLVDMATRPPIEFTVGDQTFRVPRKIRPEIAMYLAASVVHNDDGERVYPDHVIQRAMIDLLASEVWDGTAWVEVDDKKRFTELVRSQRTSIDADVLGQIIIDMTEEITADPTGGSKLSSDGPSETGAGSTDSAGPVSEPEPTSSPTPS